MNKDEVFKGNALIAKYMGYTQNDVFEGSGFRYKYIVGRDVVYLYFEEGCI